ncbi:MAG: hypothetical protein HC903_25940 [Methylacidiphilales bacterium]|nr:hypothetical protein [Candidatus Methylacidiphilales bacterium]
MESQKVYAIDISQSKIRLGKLSGTETDSAHFPQNPKSKACTERQRMYPKSKI